MELTTEARLSCVIRDTESGKLRWYKGARLAHAEGRYFAYVCDILSGEITEFKKLTVNVTEHGEIIKKNVCQPIWKGLNESLINLIINKCE